MNSLNESNEDYIKNNKNALNDLENNTEIILKQINILKQQMNNYFNSFEKSFSEFLKEVKSCKVLLSKDNIKKISDCHKNIHDKFIKCNELKNIIYENDYIKSMTELNKNIKEFTIDKYEKLFQQGNADSSNNIPNLNLTENKNNDKNLSNENLNNNSMNMKEFEDYFIYADNNIENISFNENEIHNEYSTHKIKCKEEGSDSEEEKINNNLNNNNELKCSECKLNKAINICSHCNNYYCQDCSDFYMKYKEQYNHIFQRIPDNLLDKESSKDKFINNFVSFFGLYFMKFNYLLNLEPILAKFPFIEDVNNLDSHKAYLNDINNKCPKNKIINYNNNENNIKVNEKLIKAFEKFLNDKQFVEIFKGLDNSIINFDNQNYNKKGTKFEQIKNKLFYFINVVTKGNLKFGLNIDDIISHKFSEALTIDKNNIFILINDKINNLNNFVKSKNFYELHYKHFETENPIINKLNEFKLLSDNYLCYHCNISKECFDYRGNTINPNSSNNIIRGTEKYDPPYGWIGIGLNVIGKYDSDEWLTNNSDSSEWAIAYHGINPKNSSNKVNQLLKYIITKNDYLNNAVSSIKSDSNDKRNWSKIGKGIYLTPNITIAEHYTGIIPFNNKRYKVLFMARVYIKGIREPEHSNFWVLDEKYIRIYRILFKEI